MKKLDLLSMQKMKRVFNVLLLAMIILPWGFISCDKEDKDPIEDSSVVNTITAVVENGNDYKIDAVKAFIGNGEIINFETGEIASSDYKNGRFTLSLPQTIENQYLELLFDEDEMPDAIKISDVNVKACYLWIEAYQSGTEAGEFEYEYLSADETVGIETSYTYVDRDCSIKGSYSEIDEDETYNSTYNVSLKKGWNIVYVKRTESEKTNTYTYEATSSVQSGLKWYFYEYYRYED